MRNVERFAFWFGIANVVLGALSLFRPLVKHPQPKNPVSRMIMKRQNHGLINKRPGYLLGQLGAVNPPHTILHSALGAAGIATSRKPEMATPYLGLSALLFAALAALGFAKTGSKGGIHNVAGFAVDRRGSLISSLMGLVPLAMAAWPLIQRRTNRDLEHDAARHMAME